MTNPLIIADSKGSDQIAQAGPHMPRRPFPHGATYNSTWYKVSIFVVLAAGLSFYFPLVKHRSSETFSRAMCLKLNNAHEVKHFQKHIS